MGIAKYGTDLRKRRETVTLFRHDNTKGGGDNETSYMCECDHSMLM